MYSAALCRGLIEAHRILRGDGLLLRIPRLYAAASLKHVVELEPEPAHQLGIPRLYAAASLKRHVQNRNWHTRINVFRGSMPRPH